MDGKNKIRKLQFVVEWKIEIRLFGIASGEYIHLHTKQLKFEFSSTKGTGKIQYFLYFNLRKND